MSENTMEDRIREWLNSQGYPLEMYVAREFARNRFRVTQSDYYDDPDTNDSREIDVTAHVQETIGDILLRVEFVIEVQGKSRQAMGAVYTTSTIG